MKKTILWISLMMASLPAFAYPHPGSHPRLLLKSGEELQIREAIAKEPIMAMADSAVLSFCDEVIGLPPHPRKMAGIRLEQMSEPFKRIFYLSYAYRVHGDKRYAERAKLEMLNLASFQDWNPGHFLDVSELTMGMAIGYDWLYDELSAEQKKIISTAIKEKGFDCSYVYSYSWFYRALHNWNQVCNAGLVFGAIALWDEYNADANIVLDKCFSSISLPLRDAYSEEGAYAEGYGYWAYGSTFQMLLIAGLESAFGSDMGMMDNYGKFYRSGHFMQMMNRPTGLCFNYADSGRLAKAEPSMVWMARKTGDLSLLYLETRKLMATRFKSMDMQRILPFFLIYGRDIDFGNLPKPEEKFYITSGLTPLYVYRSGWDSPDDTYLGIKAGLSSSNHSHNDVGSFVFDADGVTWADDLGVQPYLSLESKDVDLWDRKQKSERYNVYRISPFSHNIISINAHQPDVYQYVDFSRHLESEECKFAEMELKMPYWEDLNAYTRRIELNQDDSILCISDSLQARENPAEVRWTMCSMADAEIIDSTAIRLSKDGHSRILRLEGHTAKAEIWPAKGGANYDYPNPDNLMVGFTLKLEPWETVDLKIRLIKEK